MANFSTIGTENFIATKKTTGFATDANKVERMIFSAVTGIKRFKLVLISLLLVLLSSAGNRSFAATTYYFPNVVSASGTQSVCRSLTASGLTGSISHSSASALGGTSTSVTYQWYYNTSGAASTLTGATAVGSPTTYTATAAARAANLAGGSISTATAGVYYYFLYVTSAGGTNNPAPKFSPLVTVTVTGPPTGVTATASPNPICTAGNLTLTGTATGATTYAWTRPGGTAIASPTSLTTGVTGVIAANAGVYTLSASNSCFTVTATSASLVVNATAPTGVSAVASPTLLCPGANLTLTGAATGASSYLWSGPGGTAITSPTSLSTGVAGVIAANAGVYTIAATNGCGTTRSSTAIVTVSPVPSGVSATASPNPICVGDNLVLTGTASGASIYSWVGPGGTTIASPGSLSTGVTGVVAGNAGVYTLTASNGTCSAAAVSSAVVVNAPVTGLSATASPNPLCTETNLTLTGAATGATNYAWNGPGGTAITSPTSLSTDVTGIVTGNAGVYSLTASVAGCPTLTVSTGTVTVVPAPTSVSATASPNPLCVGDNLTLTGAATGASTYSWVRPGGTAITSPTSLTTGVTGVALANSGVYTLTAVNGICSVTVTSSSVVVHAPVTGVTATASPNPVCSGQNLTLTGTAGGGATTYAWSGPGGTGITSPTSLSTGVTGVAAGNAGVYTLSASTTGCPTISATSAIVTINALPSISGTGNSCVGLTTALTGTPGGGTWVSVTPATGTIGSASGIFRGIAAGTTTISYTNTSGCVITRVQTVSVIPASPIMVPGTASICNGGSVTITSNTLAFGSLFAAQSFESGVPSTPGTPVAGWNILASASYLSRTTSASNPTVSTAQSGSYFLYLNSYSDNCSGCSETIYSPSFSMTGVTGAVLSFWVYRDATGSYTGSGYAGEGFGIYLNGTPAVGGTSLGFVPRDAATAITGPLSGTSTTGTSGWYNYTVSVPTTYGGTNYILINAVSYYGNNCYLDNMTLTGNIPTPTPTTWSPSTDLYTDATFTTPYSGSSIGTVYYNPTTTILTTTNVITSTITTAGCSNTATTTVTVHAQPAVVNGGTSIMCSGTTTTLTDASTDGAWGSSNTAVATVSAGGLVTAVAAGTSTISYSNGCGFDPNVIITVQATPAVVTTPSAAGNCDGAGTSSTASGATTYLWSPAGTGSSTDAVFTANPVSSTVYTVIGTSGVCSNTATFTVTNSTNPTILVTSSTVNRCSFAPADLVTASGGTTYSWLPATGLTNAAVATPSVVATSNVVYTVTGTNAAGCSSTNTVTVNVTPSPIVSFSSSASACGGATTANLNYSGTVGSPDQYSIIYSAAAHSAGFADVSSTSLPASPVVLTVPGAAPLGVYAATVTVTNTGTGCSSTNNVSVLVSTGSTPAAISGANSFCPSSSMTLSDATAGGLWSTNSSLMATIGTSGSPVTLTSGVSSGTVIVTYTTGCGSPGFVTKTVTVNTFASCMTPCAVAGTCTNDLITNVTFAGINNTTACANGTIYTSPSASVTQGSGYTLSMATTHAGVLATSYMSAWIDFNHNGTYDASEYLAVGTGLAIGSTNTTVSNTFNIPSDAVSGMTRMRVRITRGTNPGASGACTAVTNGEYEEYYVNISCNTPAITGTQYACYDGGTTLYAHTTSGGVWTSSNTNVATVNSGGSVTGLVSGTSTISYLITAQGCSAARDVNILSAPLPISGLNAVCVGSVITLSDILPGGFWDDGGSTAGTVDFSGNVTGVSVGTTIITYSACSASVTKSVSVNASPVISGAANLCTTGLTTVTLAGAPTGGTWTSSNTGVATVNSGGLVTAVSGGTATITYTGTNTCKATVSETIGNAVPSLGTSVSPSSICSGGTSTLTVTANNVPGYFEAAATFGTVAFTPSGTFNGSSTPAGGNNDNGYYSVSLPFSFSYFGTNYAAGSNVYVSTNGTISLGTPVSGFYASTLPTATYPYDLISVLGMNLDMNTSSGGGSITYGTTGSAPNRKFVVSFNAIRDWNIFGLPFGTQETGQVVLNETSGIIDLNITTASTTAHTLGVQKAGGTSAVIVPGQNNSGTAIASSSYQFFPTTVNYTWTPSTFLMDNTGSSVVATAVTSQTTYSVNVAFGGCTSNTTLTVSMNPDPVAISGGASAFCAGSTTTLSDAVTGGTWSSSDPAIATVSLSANPTTVTGVAAGTATITYTNVCGLMVTKVVTVNSAVITGVPEVCVSSTTTLTGTPSGGTWTSVTTGVATVGLSTGVVSGVSVGTSVISYVATNGCNTIVTVGVNNSAPGPISGAGSLFCASSSITLSDGTAGGTWVTDNASVATVAITSSTVGTVTGVSGGTATITYTNGCGVPPTIVVSVNPGPAAITGYSAVCVGQSMTLGETVGGVNWTSSSPANATVNSSGVVTGVSQGSTTITVTLPSTGCFVTKPITVNYNFILPTATATASPASICPGFSSSLIAGGAPSVSVISIPFDYETVSTASGVTTDNGSATVAMPFTVNLFGTNYSTAYICANGFVNFGSATTGTNFTAVALPSTNAPRSGLPQAMVAAFWHDLNPALGGNITYGTVGSAPNRKFAVSWNGVWDKTGAGTNTGEIIFYEGQTYVDVMINTTGFGATAYNQTCGMQNAAGTIGVNAPGQNGVHYDATSQGWRFYIPSYDYAWSPPTFLSSTTGMHPFVDDPTVTTTYSVNVTDVYSGCQAVASATVSINPLPVTTPTVNVACVGGTLNLNANATGTETYSWNGPAGFTSTSAAPVITSVTTAMAGTYTVTVTSPSGCFVTNTVVATVNTFGITAINDGPACVGGTVDLTSAPSGSAIPTSYAWSGPASFTASVQNINLTTSATTAMTGIYTVTTTASGSGCTAINTTNVTINTLATAPSNDGPACEGSTVNLNSNITGTATPVSYTWSGPLSFTAATANTSLSSSTTAMSGTYNFTVTATGSGCIATGSTNVIVNNLGVVANNDAPACVGGTVNLTATPSGSLVPTNYSWSGPNTFSSTNQNPVLTSVTTAMSGTYTVTMSGTGTGCTTTSTTIVTINTLGITAANDGPACVGGTVDLTSVPSGSAIPTGYTWSGPASFSATIQDPNLTTSATTAMTGVYTVTVTAGGSGCSATNTTSVTINTLGTAPSNDGPACDGSTVNLFSNVTGTAIPTSYAWSGPLSFGAATANTSLSSVTTDMTGAYNFTVTATGSGCVATGSTNVIVNNLGVTANNDAPACVGGTVNLTATPSGSLVPTNYTWSGPSSFSSTDQNPVITGATLPMAGTYTVVMSGVGTGCTTSSTTTVTINTIGITAINDGPACVGGTVNLTSTPSGTAVPTGYAWSGPSVYSSSIQSPTLTTSATTDMTGIYTVTVTANGSNCVATTTTNVIVNDLGITATNDGPACLNAVVILTSTPSGSALPTSYSWSGPASFTNTNQNTSIAPVAFENAGVYTVTVTAVGSACTATATTNVVIRSLSINAFNDGPTCAGLTANLTSVPGGTSIPTGYSWSGPLSFSATTQNTMLAPSATDMSGTYTVTVVAVGTGCIAYATTDVLILPVPAPISGNPAVCVGLTTTLSDASSGGVWSSTNTGIATIGTAGAPTSPHLVTGLFAGTTSISYTSGNGCASVVVVTVNPNPIISGVTPVCIGTSIPLTADIPGGTWSVANSHATIGSATGIFTGVSFGTDNITYVLPTTCRTTAMGSVNPTPSAIGGTPRVCQGQTTTLNTTSGGGIWTSNNPSVATVGSTGGTTTVTGILAGTAVVTYTLGTGCYSTIVVTVNALSPITGNTPVCQSSTITLSDAALGGLWTSANLARATVGSVSGIVTGVSAGTVRISYTTFAGCLATVIATVNPTGTILGTAAVCEGATTSLSNATAGGTWSSSNGNATVGTGAGLVSGEIAGTATISYIITATGCFTTRNVTVNSAPGVINGTAVFCIGQTTTLTDATSGGSWISGSPSRATIGSADGLVTALAAGTSMITYKMPGGCQSTRIVTVNVTPGAITTNTPVCQSSTMLLHNGTAGGSWSTLDLGVATVGSTGLVTGVSGGTATITYGFTATGCQATAVVTVNPITAITGAAPICVGATVNLTDLTPGGNWSSSNTAKATVGSSTGLVTGIAGGTANITYLIPATGCRAIVVETVNALPSAILGTKVVCSGGSAVHLSDATPGGSWSSLAGSGDISVDGSGNVTGVSAGTATVSYSVSGCGVAATVTVNLSPAAITGNAPVCAGSTLALGESVSGGVWSSSAASVATVSSAGVVTGVTGGTANISYVTGAGCSASVTVTVNPINPITGIPSVCLGSTTNLANATLGGTWSSSASSIASVGTSGIVTGNIVGTATISYTIGSGCVRTTTVTVNPVPGPISGTPVVCVTGTTTLSDDGSGTWSSSNTFVATVGLSTGIVTGMSAGTAKISYNGGAGCSVSVVVTVNAGPSTIGGASSLCVGSMVTLSNFVGGGVWSSLDATVTVNPTVGTVYGVSAGTAIVTYSIGTCSRTRSMVVNATPAPIMGNPVVCVGRVTFLSDPTTPGVSWTSDNTSVATISGSGAVTGISLGTANMTYSIGTGCNASITVTVNAVPSGILGNTPLCPGYTMVLSDVSAGGSWTSNNPAIATVGTDGTVTGVSGGMATITYAVNGGGCYATTVVTVTTITPINGASAICTGSSVTLTNATAGGTWSSADGTVNIASPSSGNVSGISAGTATISYTFAVGGCVAMKVVSVNAAPTAINGNGLLCIGTQLALTDDVTGGVWSSSSPATAAVVGSTGVTTGMATGTANITYALGGCRAVVMVSVNSASAVTGLTNICAGALSNMHNGTIGGTWSSSNTAVGTISASGVLTSLIPGTTTVSYTLPSGCVSTATVTVNPVPSAINGNGPVCVGGTLALSDDVTGGTWYSSTGVATIDGSGNVTAVAIGTAGITYTTGAGCTATIVVTVGATPAPITGTLVVCEGGTTILNDATLGGVWTSSTGEATVVGSSGVVTGVTAGTTTISYTLAGCGTITVDVTVNAAPAAITGGGIVCVGNAISLSESTGGGVWSSSNGHATIDGSGNVTAVSAGTTTISYTVGGCSATTVVTVTGLPVAITAPSFICLGSTVTLYDATPGGLWSSSDGAGIITIGTGTGIVTGIGIGTASITYSIGTSCSAATILSVNVATSPIFGALDVCIGTSTLYTDATSGGAWSSSNNAVASVGTDGSVNGVSVGTATISYNTGGCISTQVITVNPAPAGISGPGAVCENLTITLGDATPGGAWSTTSTYISLDGSGHVTGLFSGVATVTYTSAFGCFVTRDININPAPTPILGTLTVCVGGSTFLSDATPGGVSWTSSDPSVATISYSGAVASAVSPGTTTVTYSITTGCFTTAVVTVNTQPAAITNNSPLCQGSSIVLSDASAGGTWSSNNTGIATVGTDGTLTGVAGGNATITYAVYGSGCRATTVVTVNPATPINGSHPICTGATMTLTDATSGGTWSSDNTAVGTISASGVVAGIGAGTANITYTTAAGCTSMTIITVNGTPSPITGTTTLCVGATVSLTNAVGGGAWSSSNGNATVDGSGNVTGVTAGTAIISYGAGAGCSATTIITINALPAAIAGSNSVCSGSTITLSDATTAGVWSSSATGTAAINATTGVVTGGTPGTATISYTKASTGCSTTVTITVNALPSSINGLGTVCAGSSVLLTDATSGGAWSSSNAAVATIATDGTVTGVAGGTARITYTSAAGCIATGVMTVSAILPISGTPSACVGFTTALSDASLGGTWSSTTSSVATVGSASGLVSALAAGTTTIIYTIPSGCSRSVVVTVSTALSPITGTLAVCQTFTTQLSDASAGGVWSSGSPSIATVGGTTGLVTGSVAGTSRITYTVGGSCATYAVVTVNPQPSGIAGASNVCLGSTLPLSDLTSGGDWSSAGNVSAYTSGTTSTIVTPIGLGTGTVTYTLLSTGCKVSKTITVNDVPGPILGNLSVCGVGSVTFLSDASAGTSWAVNPVTTATVSASGRVYGVSTGTAIVSYINTNGCMANAVVTVNALVTVAAISGPNNVSSGSTISLSDATPGGNWSTSNVAVAGVDGVGNVTGIATSGTANITYSLPYGSGCNAIAVKTITVHTPAPHSHGTTVSGTTSVFTGAAVSIADETVSGIWSSSNTSVATVDDAGTVTGIMPGTANIIHIITYSDGDVSTTVTPIVVTTPPVDIRLVPNPNNGTFTIKGNLGSIHDEEVSLEVTDVLGQVVYKGKVTAHSGKINEKVAIDKTYANGMYMLTVISSTDRQVFHFVIEN